MARPSPASRRPRTRAGSPAGLERAFQALLALVEKNTARISRLEEIFAVQAQKREEVEQDLARLRKLVRR